MNRPGLEFMEQARAAQRGLEVIPHGVDLGPDLVSLAQRRLPTFSANFHVADAWTWDPTRTWTFVYTLLDLSPVELRSQWLRRLHKWVEPRGRLIIGSYGGRTPRNDPVDVAEVLRLCGLEVSGSSRGGDPAVTRFAWTG